MKGGVKELYDAYLDSTAEFSEMLKERTPGEIAYDYEVVASLRRGLSILKALELAKEKYPDEALQWDDDTIVDIKDHYEYLMNHEDILLKGLSSKK
jgi:rubrerythrin